MFRRKWCFRQLLHLSLYVFRHIENRKEVMKYTKFFWKCKGVICWKPKECQPNSWFCQAYCIAVWTDCLWSSLRVIYKSKLQKILTGMVRSIWLWNQSDKCDWDAKWSTSGFSLQCQSLINQTSQDENYHNHQLPTSLDVQTNSQNSDVKRNEEQRRKILILVKTSLDLLNILNR